MVSLNPTRLPLAGMAYTGRMPNLRQARKPVPLRFAAESAQSNLLPRAGLPVRKIEEIPELQEQLAETSIEERFRIAAEAAVDCVIRVHLPEKRCIVEPGNYVHLIFDFDFFPERLTNIRPDLLAEYATGLFHTLSVDSRRVGTNPLFQAVGFDLSRPSKMMGHVKGGGFENARITSQLLDLPVKFWTQGQEYIVVCDTPRDVIKKPQ